MTVRWTAPGACESHRLVVVNTGTATQSVAALIAGKVAGTLALYTDQAGAESSARGRCSSPTSARSCRATCGRC